MHNFINKNFFWIVVGIIILIAFYPQLSKAFTPAPELTGEAGGSGVGTIPKPGSGTYQL
jgi:4-hydroxybenzoate polyprenyltransferase